MKITTAGIDLAENLMQVHGVDELGRTVLSKQLKRNQVPPCESVCQYFTNS